MESYIPIKRTIWQISMLFGLFSWFFGGSYFFLFSFFFSIYPSLCIISFSAYKSTLESILREASKQIRENSAFDVNMLHNNLQQENVFDDEQSVTSTEEDVEDAKNELSPIEDNASTENVDSEIGCYWRGLNGKCCQSLRIIGIRVRSTYAFILTVIVGIWLVYCQQHKIHNS